MAHIDVNKQLPGIRSLLHFRPEIAKPLSELTNVLMKEDSPGLSMADRELIGARVSYLNDCFYCRHSHAAIACEYLGGNNAYVEKVTEGNPLARITPLLQSLLVIAESVQQGGKAVTAAQVAAAKQSGATDKDIHDTVLIAALFCLFNRYVDGLAANTPSDLSTYPPRAKEVVAFGYGGTSRTQAVPSGT